MSQDFQQLHPETVGNVLKTGKNPYICPVRGKLHLVLDDIT